MLFAFDQDLAELRLDHPEPDLAALELLLRQPDLDAAVAFLLIGRLQRLERALHVSEILARPGMGRNDAIDALLGEQRIALDDEPVDIEPGRIIRRRLWRRWRRWGGC